MSAPGYYLVRPPLPKVKPTTPKWGDLPPAERPPLHFHDSHATRCPYCNELQFWTDSPKMVQEALAVNYDYEFALVRPIATTFHRVPQKIWPITCRKCHELFISHLVNDNAAYTERFFREILPTNPGLDKDPNWQKKLAPKWRDGGVTREDFVEEVATESNLFVRDKVFRDLQARGFELPWEILQQPREGEAPETPEEPLSPRGAPASSRRSGP